MKFVLVGMIGLTCVSGAMVLAEAEDTQSPRSPVQRGPVRPADTPPPSPAGAGAAQYPDDVRGIDGSWNNMANPAWGAVGSMLLRQVPNDYGDGVSTPAGAGRGSARMISNVISDQSLHLPNGMGATDFLWQWGQFIDHDIDETPVTYPGEPFDIAVPMGDAWFDPMSTGTMTIPLDRSAWVLDNGAHQQLNNITSYIDASNVYGASDARAMELRKIDGSGELQTSTGNLMPFNLNGFANAPAASDTSLFLAGDVRANEQAALTAMHTLFMREHNYWAKQIAAVDGPLASDTIYNRARGIVGAEMQAITYREFLPILLGPDALPPYAGYNPAVNASISNVFAAAAYRVGHTMLSSELQRLEPDGTPIPAGNLPLANAFFDASLIIDVGVDPYLRGLAADAAQDVDVFIIDDVRNMLFGPPGSGGLDLAALNIQRGRDHGIPSYNALRVEFGQPAAVSFADITDDVDIQAALAKAYSTVNDVDAWIGLVAEPHRPNAMVGETLFRILRDQFLRLRDGDRFWYEAYLPADLVEMVEQQTLATIIRRNTGIGSELQDNVFLVDVPCAADANDDGAVDVDDLLMVILAWGPCVGSCEADLDNNGVVNVDDLVFVITNWGVCPTG